MWKGGDAGGWLSFFTLGRRVQWSAFHTIVTPEAFYLFSLTHSTNPIWCKRKTGALAIFGFTTDNNKSMVQWVRGHFPKLKVFFSHCLNNHSTKLILGLVPQGRGAMWNMDTLEHDRQWTWPRAAFGPQREVTRISRSPQYNPKLPLTGETGEDLRRKRPRLQLGKCRASEKSSSSVNTGRKCAQPEQGFQNQAHRAVVLLRSRPLFSYKIKRQGRLNKNLCFLTPGQDFSKSTS